MDNSRDAFITLASGKTMNLFEPKVEDIRIMDIAYGLSHKGHFSGQTKKFYSIAEHSIICVELEEKLKLGVDKVYLLFHDANEAYLPDMIKPLKNRIEAWSGLEATVQRCINDKLKLLKQDYNKFKTIDMIAQAIEFKAFYPTRDVYEFIGDRLPVEYIDRIHKGLIGRDMVKYYDPRGSKIAFMDKCKQLGVDVYS